MGCLTLFAPHRAAGFVVDETSEAGVISRGWSVPSWLGHKRSIMVFGRHKQDGAPFRGPPGPLDQNEATSLSCRLVRFR